MDKYVYKGKNEEELLNHACEELKVEKTDIFYRVTEEKGGLFSGKKLSLEVVKVSDVADLAKKLINSVLEGINIKAKIETKIREGRITYLIHSDNNGRIIGKNGRILDSIQIYIRQAVFKKIGLPTNIVIDVENYKEKQNYFLEKKVKKIAREVTLSKVNVKLDPMNAYERRIVHNALAKFDYIESISEGEEPNRCVVIKYKEKE